MSKQTANARPKAVAIALPTPDISTIETRKWFQIVFSSPDAGDIRIQATPDNSSIKATIHMSLPLASTLPADAPKLPIAISHLNINLDVSKIVTFHEKAGETIYALANEPGMFPCTVENDQPTFTDDRRKLLSEAYRGYMTYALQALNFFPEIHTLDVDVYGQLDRKSTELSQIISRTNMSIFSFVKDLQMPSLQTLTIQTGYNLDVWQLQPNVDLVAIYQPNSALRPTALLAPGAAELELHTIDFSDLTTVRDHLRDENGTRIRVDLQGLNGDGWEESTVAQRRQYSRGSASAKPKTAPKPRPKLKLARKVRGARKKRGRFVGEGVRKDEEANRDTPMRDLEGEDGDAAVVGG